MDEIGAKIRTLRKAKGWSVDQLGKLAHYTNGTMISHIEQGLRKPSYKQLQAIARALEVPVSDLADDQALCRAVTNNANGDHQVVYQHVEQVKGPWLMTDDFEDRLRTIVQQELEKERALVIEEMQRRFPGLSDAARDAGEEKGEP